MMAASGEVTSRADDDGAMELVSLARVCVHDWAMEAEFPHLNSSSPLQLEHCTDSAPDVILVSSEDQIAPMREYFENIAAGCAVLLSSAVSL